MTKRPYPDCRDGRIGKANVFGVAGDARAKRLKTNFYNYPTQFFGIVLNNDTAAFHTIGQNVAKRSYVRPTCRFGASLVHYVQEIGELIFSQRHCVVAGSLPGVAAGLEMGWNLTAKGRQ